MSLRSAAIRFRRVMESVRVDRRSPPARHRKRPRLQLEALERRLCLSTIPGFPDQGDTLALSDRALQPAGLEDYGHLPLSFEINQGQTHPEVDFLSRGNGYTLFLTPEEAVLALESDVAGTSEVDQSEILDGSTLRMRLVGSNPESQVVGLDERPGRSNYLVGNDSTQWITDVSHYARVQYQDVYPGVDLLYYGTNQRQLEYDFVVAPGSDPHAIALSFEGVDQLEADDQGELVLSMPGGKIRQHKPLVYQDVDGFRQEIPGRYVIGDQGQVGFDVGSYDPARPLVIDPVLVYSTYLGGSLNDSISGIAVDGSGNAYLTGTTRSADFPVFPGPLSDSPPHSWVLPHLAGSNSRL